MPHAELRDLLQQRGCRWLVADDRECDWTRAGWGEATVPVNQQCHRSAQDSAVAQIQTVRGVCISETQWCTPPQHASTPFCGALNVLLQSAQSVDGHCGLGWCLGFWEWRAVSTSGVLWGGGGVKTGFGGGLLRRLLGRGCRASGVPLWGVGGAWSACGSCGRVVKSVAALPAGGYALSAACCLPPAA